MKPRSHFDTQYDLVHPQRPSEMSLGEVVLANRGISETQSFLAPCWSDQHDPFLMHNMQEVVERVHRAVEQGERVVIYSDYDADGIPGAVTLSDLFRKIGYTNFEVYIPNRNTEGFGLNMQAVEQFISQEVDLLITIDCGIADLAEISQLQEGSVEVIVTDHHLPSTEGEPDCLILNPKQSACSYPFPELCGSGVIFKFVQAFISYTQKTGVLDTQVPEGWEKWLLDMVGIATICDMVPLVGENRTFAYYGLKVLRKSPRPGLRALLEKARINQATLSAQDIAFGIGPRINAASRLGDPMVAYQALSSSNKEEAAQAASKLEQLNRQRKTRVAAAARAAYKQIESQEEDQSVIVVGDTSWPLGIVGLLAGSIAERYAKPAFVWTRVGEQYKGSVRSGGVCSINTLMNQCAEETFVSYGGHTAAGGFVCDVDAIHRLNERLEAAYVNCPPYEIEKTSIDTVITTEEVNTATYQELASLEPHGVGNQAPLFMLKEVEVVRVRWFGKEESHVALTVRSANCTVQAIAFNYASKHETFPQQGDRLDLVAEFELNRYQGREELRLRIADLFY